MFPHGNDRPPTGETHGLADRKVHQVLIGDTEAIVPLSGPIASVAPRAGYSLSIQAIIGRSWAPTTSIGWWVPSSAHLV
jgi:hypothetical protein